MPADLRVVDAAAGFEALQLDILLTHTHHALKPPLRPVVSQSTLNV